MKDFAAIDFCTFMGLPQIQASALSMHHSDKH